MYQFCINLGINLNNHGVTMTSLPITILIKHCMNYGKILSETSKVITYLTKNGLRVVITKRRNQ
jgi:hypothetical protein